MPIDERWLDRLVKQAIAGPTKIADDQPVEAPHDDPRLKYTGGPYNEHRPTDPSTSFDSVSVGGDLDSGKIAKAAKTSKAGDLARWLRSKLSKATVDVPDEGVFTRTEKAPERVNDFRDEAPKAPWRAASPGEAARSVAGRSWNIVPGAADAVLGLWEDVPEAFHEGRDIKPSSILMGGNPLAFVPGIGRGSKLVQSGERSPTSSFDSARAWYDQKTRGDWVDPQMQRIGDPDLGIVGDASHGKHGTLPVPKGSLTNPFGEMRDFAKGRNNIHDELPGERKTVPDDPQPAANVAGRPSDRFRTIKSESGDGKVGALVGRATELSMDEASRMARARAMGFDVDNPVWHGTRSKNIGEFKDELIGTGHDGGHYGRGHYFVNNPGEARYYGPNVEKYYIRRGKELNLDNNTGDLTWPGHFKSWTSKMEQGGMGEFLSPYARREMKSLAEIDQFVKESARTMPARHWNGTEGYYAKATHPKHGDVDGGLGYHGYAKTPEEAIEHLTHRLYDKVQPSLDTPSLSDYVRVGDGGGSHALTDIAKRQGYNTIGVADETVVFDPARIRKADAAFDPDKIDSRNVLAAETGGNRGVAGLVGKAIAPFEQPMSVDKVQQIVRDLGLEATSKQSPGGTTYFRARDPANPDARSMELRVPSAADDHAGRAGRWRLDTSIKDKRDLTPSHVDLAGESYGNPNVLRDRLRYAFGKVKDNAPEPGSRPDPVSPDQLRLLAKTGDKHLTFGPRLGEHVNSGTKMPDADFWVYRRGDAKSLGKVLTEYNPEAIGIKNRNHAIDPSYLRYALENVYNQGWYKGKGTGSTNLQNIKVGDVDNIPIQPSSFRLKAETGTGAGAILAATRGIDPKLRANVLSKQLGISGDEAMRLVREAANPHAGRSQQQVRNTPNGPVIQGQKAPEGFEVAMRNAWVSEGGNIPAIAKALDVSLSTVHRYKERLGLGKLEETDNRVPPKLTPLHERDPGFTSQVKELWEKGDGINAIAKATERNYRTVRKALESQGLRQNTTHGGDRTPEPRKAESKTLDGRLDDPAFVKTFLAAMDEHKGNQSAVAKQLGISQPTVGKYRDKLGGSQRHKYAISEADKELASQEALTRTETTSRPAGLRRPMWDERGRRDARNNDLEFVRKMIEERKASGK